MTGLAVLLLCFLCLLGTLNGQGMDMGMSMKAKAEAEAEAEGEAESEAEAEAEPMGMMSKRSANYDKNVDELVQGRIYQSSLSGFQFLLGRISTYSTIFQLI